MSKTNWLAVLGRITSQSPLNLDADLADLDPRHASKPGILSFPEAAAKSALPTSFSDEETVAFAARVTEETKDPIGLAVTLAQMAFEKGAEVVILSHLDYSGLERFGFRVERVAGETEAERAASEAQLIRFWNIVFVI